MAFRIAIILMLANNWDADVVDIETAFLCGNLDKDIYMKVPEGLAEYLDTKYNNKDCLVLIQAMYGLVQAARQYYKKFINVMVTKLGFKKCLAGRCLLKRLDGNGTIIICVCVNNILCIGN